MPELFRLYKIIKPVVSAQTVGIEFEDKNAQLAAEFIKGIIDKVTKG